MSTMTDEEMEAMMAEIEASAPATAPAAKPAPAAVETPPWEETPKPAAAPSAAAPMEASAAPMEASAAPVVSEEPPAPVSKPAATPTPAATSGHVASGDGTALKTFVDPDQVKVDISINMSDLDTAMIEHPGLELHYAMQTAHSRRQYERLKAATEILEAKIDAETREKWVGEKKPTEAAIKAAVLADKRYSSAQSKLIDAQHIWKLCEATENAFRSRKDLLLEVARDRRKEKEGQMRVLEGQEMRESVMKALRDAKAA